MLLEKKKLSTILLNDSHSLYDVINNLNKTGLKIVCIVGKKNFFIGIITDGDIRRAILNKYNLNSNVKRIINYSPIIYKDKISLFDIKKKIEKEDLDHLPLIKKKKNCWNLYK
jgi:CBS domain-containing protein